VTGSQPVVCVLVDAFRHDYLDDGKTPFLAQLASEHGVERMRPILGYSDAIRATIFTGAYPDEHGYWMEYCFRPERSPFRSFARLAPLDRLPSDFALRALKFGLSKTVVRAIARKGGYADLSLRHLPFRALGCFDWTLHAPMTARGVLGAPTIFDRLTDAGLRWSYLDSARNGTRAVLRALDGLPRETALAFVYLHQIDMASHLVGLESPIFERVLRRTDVLAAEVVRRARRRLGDPALVVFSDHGMSKVERLVGFRDLVLHPGFPERFCFALDATMVRLWYRDDDPVLREELRARLRDRAGGHFLDATERGELHLDFDDRLYGDDIYLIDAPTAIFPNFHSMVAPRAMHAYHPDGLDQHGIFIAPGAGTGREEVELVEVTRAVETGLALRGVEADRALVGASG
jgi:predicted AlkP superfamily pyrophosphatase or phosphodiesterase